MYTNPGNAIQVREAAEDHARLRPPARSNNPTMARFKLKYSDQANIWNRDRHDEVLTGVVKLRYVDYVVVVVDGWRWAHTVLAKRVEEATAQMNPTEDFTTPQAIADALDALAERLRALPRTEIPATRVDLDLWVHGDSFDDAHETVDLLGYALAGETGAPGAIDDDFYRTPCAVAYSGLVARAMTAVPAKETTNA